MIMTVSSKYAISVASTMSSKNVSVIFFLLFGFRGQV
jgi:hypothetical protein